MAAPGQSSQKSAIEAIVAELEKIERAEVKPTVIGVLGATLFFGAAYLVWRGSR
jgi:hypothetical protein